MCDENSLLLYLSDQSYRTCSECGSDYLPDPFDAGGGLGTRIAFICPTCGVHSVIDPFPHLR